MSRRCHGVSQMFKLVYCDDLQTSLRDRQSFDGHIACKAPRTSLARHLAKPWASNRIGLIGLVGGMIQTQQFVQSTIVQGFTSLICTNSVVRSTSSSYKCTQFIQTLKENRPGWTWISTRPRGSELSTMSTIYANRSRPRSLASRRSRHRPQRWGQNSQRNLYNYTSPFLYKSHLYKPQLYKLICIARYTNSGSRPAAIGWHRTDLVAGRTPTIDISLLPSEVLNDGYAHFLLHRWAHLRQSGTPRLRWRPAA